MAVKHLDIGEFRELGFLQEANRLFFHPHGLALEITVITPDGWDDPGPAMQARVDAVAASLRAAGVAVDACEDAAKAVLTDMYPVGSRYLSGVWDYREDPEGIVFGDWDDDEWVAKAEAVNAERRRHFDVRADLFGVPREIRYAVTGADVEPAGWKPSPEQIAAWEKQGEEADAE